MRSRFASRHHSISGTAATVELRFVLLLLQHLLLPHLLLTVLLLHAADEIKVKRRQQLLEAGRLARERQAQRRAQLAELKVG